MKLALVAVALIFASFSALADESLACAAVAHSSIQKIEAALKSLDPSSQVKGVALNEKSAMSAVATVSLANGKQKVLDVNQNCIDGKLEISESPNPQNYVCQKGYIDCMPGEADPEHDKYCTQDFIDWSIKNCGGAPSIAY